MKAIVCMVLVGDYMTLLVHENTEMSIDAMFHVKHQQPEIRAEENIPPWIVRTHLLGDYRCNRQKITKTEGNWS